jgi:hypothetical protein
VKLLGLVEGVGVAFCLKSVVMGVVGLVVVSVVVMSVVVVGVVMVFMDIIVVAQTWVGVAALEVVATRAWCTSNVQWFIWDVTAIQEMANNDLFVDVVVNVMVVGVRTANEASISPK